MGVCNCSMFCCTLLYVHSSIAIILMGKRELIALLNLSSWCLVMVERLFLAVPQGCLQFVIVVFPDNTHLLFFTYRKWVIFLTVPKRYLFCGSSVFFLYCVCNAFVHTYLYVPCGHLLGKVCPLGFRLWCLVRLSLTHWYLGSGVALDCIDS